MRRQLLKAMMPSLQRLANKMAESILATEGLASAFRGLRPIRVTSCPPPSHSMSGSKADCLIIDDPLAEA
jgi:hypothetical protein